MINKLNKGTKMINEKQVQQANYQKVLKAVKFQNEAISPAELAKGDYEDFKCPILTLRNDINVAVSLGLLDFENADKLLETLNECGAQHLDSGDYCMLQKGHTGKHLAYSCNGRLAVRWSDEG